MDQHLDRMQRRVDDLTRKADDLASMAADLHQLVGEMRLAENGQGELPGIVPPSEGERLRARVAELEAAIRAAIGHLGDLTRPETARAKAAQRVLREALGETVAAERAAD